MRIAVLGVGLIGGSIGLAARRRLGADVIGFDPDSSNLELALKVGALDHGADSILEAVDGVEAVFCAAPVAELPRLVGGAIAASGPGTVVTDVGSTKLGLVDAVAGLSGYQRFIGGHPLAGAETAGVEGSREDLFEGA
ncbi:MAG: prephenate dehydrogenase/arogenate dehydrogenase family protein, partial [Solirubrobacterales bacterium]